jgi:hypothetical protein
MAEKQNVGAGTAKVADVKIKGLPNIPIDPPIDVVITLSGDDTFNEIEANVDVSNWFTNRPDTNLIAKVKEYVESEATSVTITMSGTVSQWNADALVITIPIGFTSSEDAIDVTTNPDARYDIAMVIGDEAGFAAFAAQVNGGKLTLSGDLQADIEIPSTMTYIPIARDWHNSYQGEFNGNDHTIKITLEGEGSYLALFGVNNGIIHNLTVEGSVTLDENATDADYIAGVVAYNDVNGHINHVIADVAVKAYTEDKPNNAHSIGGIAGFNGCDIFSPDSPYYDPDQPPTYIPGGYIFQCKNKGAITGGFNKIGGIVGENAGSIKQCVNTGAITDIKGAQVKGWPGVGGIAGRNGNNNEAKEEGTIENCYNRGEIIADVETTTEENAYGGITGWCDVESSVKSCYTTGLFAEKTGDFRGVKNPIIGTADTEPEGMSVNNYSLVDVKAANEGNIALTGTRKTGDEMKSEALVTALNQYGVFYKYNGPDDFPTLLWED